MKMKNCLWVLMLSTIVSIYGCNLDNTATNKKENVSAQGQNDNTPKKKKTNKNAIYRDLAFGMSVEEVNALGYFISENKTIDLNDRVNYQMKYTDFNEINYKRAQLTFNSDQKLVKILFFNSTESAVEQQEISKKISDYLTSKYGPSKAAGKCDGWKDKKNNIYLLYVHSEIEGGKLIYYNEFNICSENYNKK